MKKKEKIESISFEVKTKDIEGRYNDSLMLQTMPEKEGLDLIIKKKGKHLFDCESIRLDRKSCRQLRNEINKRLF